MPEFLVRKICTRNTKHAALLFEDTLGVRSLGRSKAKSSTIPTSRPELRFWMVSLGFRGVGF